LLIPTARYNKANELSPRFNLSFQQERYSFPQSSTTGVRFMGILTVHCPIEPTLFGTTAVFFSSTYCPHRRVRHEWFVKERMGLRFRLVNMATRAAM
jgi:hypothetical protein